MLEFLAIGVIGYVAVMLIMIARRRSRMNALGAAALPTRKFDARDIGRADQFGYGYLPVAGISWNDSGYDGSNAGGDAGSGTGS